MKSARAREAAITIPGGTMQKPSAKVVDLAEEVVDLVDYRRSKHPVEEQSTSDELIHEIAFHLLKAIQAVKKLPH